MPPGWHSEEWELRVAGIAASVFLRKHAITARLTGLEPEHWLWPSFARVRQMALSGHLPDDEPAARKRAVVNGVFGCVDEVRAVLGRARHGRDGPSLRFRRRLRPLTARRPGRCDSLDIGRQDPGYGRVDAAADAVVALRRMHPRARLYVRLYLGLGDGVSRSMAEVAALVGFTETRVHQVVTSAGVSPR